MKLLLKIIFVKVLISSICMGQIPKDAKLFQGHYYKVYNGTSTTWSQARKECAKLKGTLAVIKSPTENHFITTKLVAVDTGNANCAWIGGYAKEVLNLRWFWVDEQSISFYKNFLNRSCEKFNYGKQSRIVLIGNNHPKIPIETKTSRYKNWVQTNESGASKCYPSYTGNCFYQTKRRYWVCEWDPRSPGLK